MSMLEHGEEEWKKAEPENMTLAVQKITARRNDETCSEDSMLARSGYCCGTGLVRRTRTRASAIEVLQPKLLTLCVEASWRTSAAVFVLIPASEHPAGNEGLDGTIGIAWVNHRGTTVRIHSLFLTSH